MLKSSYKPFKKIQYIYLYIVVKTAIFYSFLAFLEVKKYNSETSKRVIEKILSGSNRAYMS